ncbi:hypothetical protein FJ872_07830 [Mesorhizobium sp. B2-5-9]|uniref:hypothetical protein n=1 Tax=Mesorhizobium sp. B2-5-9 TaxID=2589921 RepID=UPI00112B209D|nr:hypothetical protein [Mesorhizobium sp. B2-5-9]TPK21979.1 hypothetical protein FJ872_07830 [Mesorhizobium sp. B2-5-9]
MSTTIRAGGETLRARWLIGCGGGPRATDADPDLEGVAKARRGGLANPNEACPSGGESNCPADEAEHPPGPMLGELIEPDFGCLLCERSLHGRHLTSEDKI